MRRIAAFGGVLSLAASLFAQTGASLTGTATSGGAALPGVVITITSSALQGTRTAVTGPAGAYYLSPLPPGDYNVIFELPGMQPVSKATRLQLAQTSRVDAGMRMRAGSETVIVIAGAPPAVETRPLATNFTLEEIDRLPYQRNQLATAQLAPGVTANTLGNGELQISGGPGYDNLALINGVVVTENVRSQMRPMYVEDAIQETTVLAGAIPAEYGRFTGGVITSITRSGGNEISGSLRDSLTNPAWSAQTPANETRTDTLNHVWESTLGGFVIRDRLWFFGAGRLARNDTARQTVAVPAFTGTPPSTASPPLSYNESNDQKRVEVKLTARLHTGGTIVGSYFSIDTGTNNSRFGNSIYDAASLNRQKNSDSLTALRYDGVVAPNFLITGQYSRRTMALNSGSMATDLLGGTVLLDRANGNARFNSPALCAACGS